MKKKKQIKMLKKRIKQLEEELSYYMRDDDNVDENTNIFQNTVPVPYIIKVKEKNPFRK